MLDTHVDQAALAGDAQPVDDVELGLFERRGELVLDDLDAGAVAHRVGAVLEGLDAADVQADRRVELQRLAAGGRLRRSEHHTDLFSELVDEDRRRATVADRPGELAQSLGHQPRLEPDVAVAHLALDLGPGNQRCHRVDDDDVDRTGTDQHVRDLERLLTGVGLAHQQSVCVDAQLLGIVGVERVLGIDECRDAAGLLGACHRVEGDRRLARALRAVDLDDAPTGQPADAQCDVQGDGPSRNDVDGDTDLVAEPHHRTLAVRLLDLRHHCFQRLRAIWSSHVLHLSSLNRSPSSTCDRHLCGAAFRVESDVTSDRRQPHPPGADLCRMGPRRQPMGTTYPNSCSILSPWCRTRRGRSPRPAALRTGAASRAGGQPRPARASPGRRGRRRGRAVRDRSHPASAPAPARHRDTAA